MRLLPGEYELPRRGDREDQLLGVRRGWWSAGRRGQPASGSTELLDEVAQSKITGEEERYAHLDLLDMAADVQGSRKGYALLRPGLLTLDQNLASSIDQRFAELATYQAGNRWLSYHQLQPAELQSLSQAVNNLAEPMSRWQPALSWEASNPGGRRLSRADESVAPPGDLNRAAAKGY